MKYGNYTINEEGNTSVSKIVTQIKENSKVIELGSSYGYILKYLKDVKNCSVRGYEIDKEAVKLANEHNIPTVCTDLDNIDSNFFKDMEKDLDYIICADVLEHLKNMKYVLDLLSKYLERNTACQLLISYPNITYYGVIRELLHGKFKYNDLGILDETHLQFYDKFELENLFNRYNLEIISMAPIEVDPLYSEFGVELNENIIKLLDENNHQDYMTYQYVFSLKYNNHPKKKIVSNNNSASPLNELHIHKITQVKDLIQTINIKDSQIIELNEAVQTKDSQIIELNEAVQTKDSQIIELSEHVNRKDAQVIEVNTLAHTQQDTIQTMAQTIDKLHSQINTLTTKLQNDIDISIVTYNSKKWIDTFFESLLKQNYPLKKIHLYITDNNSTDDTYVYLQSLNTKYSNIFATFDLKQEKNLGFGFGHNNNFKRSHSQFVLATNIDLQFEEDAITNLVRYAQTDDRTTASWEMRQKPYEHPKYYNPITFETTWSSSACILFRKEAINKIGGYDDHIFMYGEDVELSYRLRDNGYKLKYYPKAVCWHYTYAEAGEIKEVQYFGSTIANVLIRMRYGNKTEIKEGLRMYKGLLNTQGLIYNQRRKQLIYLLKLMYKAPFFLLNRKKRRDISYKFINWDYEFIRDGAFYNYTEEKLTDIPLVSVIMRTCCERNEFLKEAIQSVINQTYTNIELVVVEDGSDNAKEIIENIIATNLTNIIYKPIEKAGRCHAGNEGLASAHGKYMIFLDDDDLFFADHLEVLVNELEKNPDTAACYSSSFEVKTDVISKLPLQYKEKEFTIIHKEEFSRETMLHHNYIPIQSILFKRELYLRYGGFDEELDNLEDWNLWTRYSYLNNFKFIDKTTSLYRVPSCPDSSAKRQKELDRYYQIALEKQKKFIQSL